MTVTRKRNLILDCYVVNCLEEKGKLPEFFPVRFIAERYIWILNPRQLLRQEKHIMSPPYKLTYFDIMGLAEPIRIILSYGNLEFEDCRIPRENWPNVKPNMPFGQVPVLEYNGVTYHQSMAITRYLAKQVKLVGKDDIEDLEIDAAVDTVNDFRTKIGKYHYETDETAKEAYAKTLFNEIVPFYLEKLDNQAKKNSGYLVGNKLTWADLVFVGLIDYINFMAKKDLLASAPNLQKVKEHVVEVPNVKKYMEKRLANH